MEKSQLNDSAHNLVQQSFIANRLDTILSIAKYISYGYIFAAVICIIAGVSCDISNLLDVMESTRLHGKAAAGALIMYPLAILGCGLNYLIPFAYAYIFHSMNLSIDVVKPDYQVSSKSTSFLIWGWGLAGILSIIIDIAGLEFEVLQVLFGLFAIALVVVGAVWARKLSQKWSTLSPAHQKTADLLKIYAYLSVGVFVVSAIAYAIDNTFGDIISIISTCVDLYLFYKLGSCYHEIVLVCLNTYNSEES